MCPRIYILIWDALFNLVRVPVYVLRPQLGPKPTQVTKTSIKCLHINHPLLKLNSLPYICLSITPRIDYSIAISVRVSFIRFLQFRILCYVGGSNS